MKKRVCGLIAICLIICLVVPAQYSSATSKMKMNKSSKVLYLNWDNMTQSKDSFDFNIINKGANYKTKYKFAWKVDNNSIISINKSGVVTGKKVGTTKVKCDVIKKSNNKLYTTVSATVTVKANAEAVVIKNRPENNTIVIGETFDFNRTMKAANDGKATDKTKWFSSDSSILTIDKNGVVTGLTPGKAEIMCKTYQSAATLSEGYTAESDKVEVTVVNKLTNATVTAPDQVCLRFAGPIDKKDVSEYFITKKESNKRNDVKAVTLSEDKTTAEVTLTDMLEVSEVYNVSITGVVGSKEISISTAEPYTIVVADTEGPALVYNPINVKLLNIDGVDVTRFSNRAYLSAVIKNESGAIIKKGEDFSYLIYGSKSKVKAEVSYSYSYDKGDGSKAEILLVQDYSFTEPLVTPTPAPMPSGGVSNSASRLSEKNKLITKLKNGLANLSLADADNAAECYQLVVAKANEIMANTGFKVGGQIGDLSYSPSTDGDDKDKDGTDGKFICRFSISDTKGLVQDGIVEIEIKIPAKKYTEYTYNVTYKYYDITTVTGSAWKTIVISNGKKEAGETIDLAKLSQLPISCNNYEIATGSAVTSFNVTLDEDNKDWSIELIPKLTVSQEDKEVSNSYKSSAVEKTIYCQGSGVNDYLNVFKKYKESKNISDIETKLKNLLKDCFTFNFNGGSKFTEDMFNNLSIDLPDKYDSNYMEVTDNEVLLKKLKLIYKRGDSDLGFEKELVFGDSITIEKKE